MSCMGYGSDAYPIEVRCHCTQGFQHSIEASQDKHLNHQVLPLILETADGSQSASRVSLTPAKLFTNLHEGGAGSVGVGVVSCSVGHGGGGDTPLLGLYPPEGRLLPAAETDTVTTETSARQVTVISGRRHGRHVPHWYPATPKTTARGHGALYGSYTYPAQLWRRWHRCFNTSHATTVSLQ